MPTLHTPIHTTHTHTHTHTHTDTSTHTHRWWPAMGAMGVGRLRIALVLCRSRSTLNSSCPFVCVCCFLLRYTGLLWEIALPSIFPAHYSIVFVLFCSVLVWFD